jgi:deoxycytidine triphosphate deaminase
VSDSAPPGFPAQDGGAVLTDTEIQRLVDERGLISDFLVGSLSGASYDLRLGRECFTGGEMRMLTDDLPSVRLEPGQFILLTSLECLTLPDDVAGHAGLISRWAQRGLISLFSPQIDPGFQGLIVVPLFNAGDGPVTLRYGETMFTVEFVRTTGTAEKVWIEHHAPLMHISPNVEVDMARPDLTELTTRIHALEHKIGELEGKYQGVLDESSRRDTSLSAQLTYIGVIIAMLGAVAAIVIAAVD